MRILQQARLEQARIEMLRAGQSESLARIAAEHGFSSPTRFAQSFRSKYGVYPSEICENGATPCPDSRIAGDLPAGVARPSGFARASRADPQ